MNSTYEVLIGISAFGGNQKEFQVGGLCAE
jgi:hypothetical protein